MHLRQCASLQQNFASEITVAAVAALSKQVAAAVAVTQAEGAPAIVVMLSPLAEIAATPITTKVKTKTAAAASFSAAWPGAEPSQRLQQWQGWKRNTALKEK